MNMSARNEVHVCSAPNGHKLSVDCWCEPTRINWVRNKHGIDVLIVEHDDLTLAHHNDVLLARERDIARSVPRGQTWGTEEPWITRALEYLSTPEGDTDVR